MITLIILGSIPLWQSLALFECYGKTSESTNSAYSWLRSNTQMKKNGIYTMSLFLCAISITLEILSRNTLLKTVPATGIRVRPLPNLAKESFHWHNGDGASDSVNCHLMWLPYAFKARCQGYNLVSPPAFSMSAPTQSSPATFP